jgi:MerR family transcriptional regulator, light-induced transcriptional regulator
MSPFGWRLTRPTRTMNAVQTKPGAAEPVPRARSGDQPELSVAAAARRLGVAPATLRTWDRRYGIGPSEHTPGRHRRYSPDDVARLELMQHALVRGASPADAARYATSAPPPGPGLGHPDLLTEPRREPGERANGHVQIRVGGAALRLSGAGRRAHGLARAALMLDPIPVRALLAESVANIGVESTWEEVVRPVLNAIAERWEHTGTGVEVEHQLSECVAAVFGMQAARSTPAAGARPVLIAGMRGEQHTLPMVVLAAVLAGYGVPCRTLGANLPATAMAAAVRRTAPSVVVLWAQLAVTADVEALSLLPRTRPRFHTFVAGPGWADLVLPPRVGWLDTLAVARTAITGMVAV